MARWSSYRRRRYGSYSRRGSGRKWSPTTQISSTTTAAGQSSLVVAHNRLNNSSATLGTMPLGPIMKVKNFRINAVFAASLSVLWALVYVPEGTPIGTINVAPAVVGPAAGFYEPQQFLIASGLYSSAASGGGMNAGPLRVWSPLARNLNPGDGIYFIWRAFDFTGHADTLITFSYACCVN